MEIKSKGQSSQHAYSLILLVIVVSIYNITSNTELMRTELPLLEVRPDSVPGSFWSPEQYTTLLHVCFCLKIPSCSWEHGQHLNTTHKGHFKYEVRDFSGDLVVRNLPANAGDTGLVPALGSFHMAWGNWTHASPALKPTHPKACALQKEKSLQWEAHTLQLESSLHLPQLEKAHTVMKTQCSQKIN